MRSLCKVFSAIVMFTFSAVAFAAPKVLIVVTSHDQMGDTGEKTGLYLSEMTHPYHELTKVGIKVDIASIKGGASPIDPKSLTLDDEINQDFLANPDTRALLDNTMKLANVDASNYDAILFAGGHGTVWDFPNSPAVNTVSSKIYGNGGFVAAVCHGPAALLNIYDASGKPIIQGKKVAGFSNAEEEAVGLTKVVPYLLQDELIAKGALYQEGDKFTTFVVRDDRIITGQNPQSASELGRVLANALLK
ncbi:type 1 glutamine amidotransferase domain-containing protein [Shewanella zhangzhouensis]|uniref:type 1 glutamine amidotransferase domain-containing protein n=1 Tax=Shewanella zhangzhouensis TaxID=2864213 RepID=UPI001C660140|nr:type 1 glutamine amidotransferase domain-containing protein [Shewanella zhangzhouensis]QYK07027.1 type 1 glutamine amidotransferase domain-containing protein [Shewanella zhangzhouensis]